MRRFRFKASMLLIFTLCAGCSNGSNDEPSEAEIIGALHAQFDKAIAQVIELGDNDAEWMAPELHSAKKIACAKATDNGGYNCDVEMDVSMPLVGRSSDTKSVRFVKSDAEWVAIEN